MQLTLAQFLAQSNAAAATQSWGQMARAMVLGEAGDPMYGVDIPEIGMNWNDTTEDQSETIMWYAINQNLPAGVPKAEPANVPLKDLFTASAYAAMVKGVDIYTNWSITKWENALGFKFQQR